MKFTHLHVHTKYSLLDGAADIGRLLDKAKNMGMDSIAITDHGVMYGVIDFYEEAKKRGIKPIIGCEVYTAPRSRLDKVHGLDSDYGHLVLLAKNNKGYKNLMELVSFSHMEGYYYKPRVDMELLRKHSDGIIALSACLRGDIAKAIEADNIEKAKNIAKKFIDIYGRDNFCLEIQNHGIELEKKVENTLVDMAKELGVKIVATNDVHYVDKKDALMQDVLTCIQTGKKLDDTDRMKFVSDDYYMKSPSEMLSLFPHIPEALENTSKVADMCNVEIDLGNMYLPKFKSDMPYDNKEYLLKLCNEGLLKKYGKITDEITDRLNFELDTINKMGYTDYFLIVWDFIKYAKENGIIVGPGRGSAAGSLVSYALGITEVDPLKYNLLFERFLNPERVSMPDIDIDFCYARRDEVKKYVIDKYGHDHVAHIATFGTFAARAAVRDVGRVMNVPYADVDRVAKAIPEKLHITLGESLSENRQLKMMYDTDMTVKKMIDIAMSIEGFPRHVSTHAAGIVITDEEVYHYVPVVSNEMGLLTQFPMNILEKLGLLKMDFLGLRNLTVIKDCIDFVKKYKGYDITDDVVDFTDTDTYNMISKGDTDGVFQLESPGMKSFLKKLKPDKLEDIIAAISLYRPGPMEQIPNYLKNRQNPDGITYKDERLKEILSSTYGTVVYQEQVMKIVRSLAGYSLGRADLVRRMMSKKKFDVMMKEKEVFLNGLKDENGNTVIAGALNNGVSKETAEEIFDSLIDFANYAFNKSHAAAYAVVAFKTAYLKCHYPTEFLAALLKSLLGSSNKTAKYIADFSKYGIKLLPPDINKSEAHFTVEGKNVRFGLSALKNIGYTFPEKISLQREANGEFLSFDDFVRRMARSEMNKRTMEVLVKSGAFDSIFKNRRQLMLNLDEVMDADLKDIREHDENQINWFDDVENKKNDASIHECEDYTLLEKLEYENEYSGMYLSGHPLDDYRLKAAAFSDMNIIKLYDDPPKGGKILRLCGVISARHDKRTKGGKIISDVTLDDFYSSISVTVFSQVLSRSEHILKKGTPVCMEVSVNTGDEGDIELILKSVTDLRRLDVTSDKKLYLRLKDRSGLSEVRSITEKFPGKSELVIYFEDVGKMIRADKENRIKLSNELIKILSDLLGDDNVRIK